MFGVLRHAKPTVRSFLFLHWPSTTISSGYDEYRYSIQRRIKDLLHARARLLHQFKLGRRQRQAPVYRRLCRHTRRRCGLLDNLKTRHRRPVNDRSEVHRPHRGLQGSQLDAATPPRNRNKRYLVPFHGHTATSRQFYDAVGPWGRH